MLMNLLSQLALGTGLLVMNTDNFNMQQMIHFYCMKPYKMKVLNCAFIFCSAHIAGVLYSTGQYYIFHGNTDPYTIQYTHLTQN